MNYYVYSSIKLGAVQASGSAYMQFYTVTMDDDHFRKVLDHLNYSWEGYRKVRKGVKKRIYRHMQRQGCRNIADYLNILDQREDCRQECELLMTVSISRFFRDRRLWEMLEHRWMPDIISKDPLKIKVWSAGCACGEEVYSFKILWAHLKKRIASLPHLKVVATDSHPGYLERARKGIYNLSSLKEITLDSRANFFESHVGAKQFEIKSEFKSDIHWKRHHLLTDPPISGNNVIFLRNNVLTYYRKEVQKSALTGILKGLTPGGVLIIGCHEILPFKTPELKSLPPFSYAFQKEE